MKTTRPLFYGIPAIYLIWHGEWSDPELSYRGRIINYFTVENHFWAEFSIENPQAQEDDFDKWILQHQRDVKDFILEVTS